MINLSVWGVKGVCWGGGGEATLNIRLPEIIRISVLLGMENSIITNAVHLPDEMIDALLLCRWIGISLDSADMQVYEKVRGTNDCIKVLNNILKLTQRRTATDISIKVLVLPETIDSIVFTCQVAKDLGVQSFHVRPVDLERKDFNKAEKLDLDMGKVQGIFDECHALETPKFRVYTVTHKYNKDFHVKHDFNRCMASPLVAQICTDKKFYVCVDHRLEPRFEIEKWGSDQHRKLLQGIEPDKDCGRCTWSEYNRQISECVIEDRLCRNFP